MGDSLLQRGYQRARSEHGALGLDFPVYAERVLALTRVRLERTSPGSALDPGRLERALEHLHLVDLHLAIACDQGRDGAFDHFLALYPGRLLAFLGRAGSDSAQASGLLQDLQGDLASPPPDRRARTRFGTYAGASSLFSWLAVILLRRRTDLARSTGSATVAQRGDRGAPLETRASGSAGPVDELLGREAGERVASALRTTYDAMTVRERLCLLYRFQDDLAQKEIARRLAIGEPRVSRLLDQAVDKLRRNLVSASAAERLAPDEGSWPRVRDSVGICLRSLMARDAQQPAARRRPSPRRRRCGG